MSNKLLNSFATKCITKMYLQSELADVHFVFRSAELAPPEKVPAHKDLLASASSVFNAMFYGPLKEGDTVEITDSNASAFKELLQFIYLPEVTLTNGNIEEVVRLADKYDMLDCFDTCAEFLEAHVTSENILWGYQLAISLNNAKLMEFCEEHIQFYTKEVLRSEMFLQCNREVIDHILKLDTLECNEVELFNACIEWAKASCQKDGLDENNSENLKNQLGPCFYSFRFGAMDGEEIGTILLNKVVDGMFTKDELADIMRSRCSKRSQLELFNHQTRLKPIYTWNTANKLVCTPKHYFDDEPRYTIQQQESTWFSTNERVLLGELLFVSVKQYDDYDSDDYYVKTPDKLCLDIKIIEYDSNNFATNVPSKQLYSINNISSGSTLLLKDPIVIRSNKMYEIRLHPKSGVGLYSHTWSWGNQKIKLNEKISIEFHQNSSENNSARRGLVSEMYFNRME